MVSYRRILLRETSIETMRQGGLKDSTYESNNHNHPIPLLMQSVALHIVAFVVFKRLLCGWLLFDKC